MIKKKEAFVFVFFIMLILVLGLISAGLFSDSWDKIKGTFTGNAISMCIDSESTNSNPADPFVKGVLQSGEKAWQEDGTR